MTYDYHGAWESTVDHHAPLYNRTWDTLNLPFWVDFTVNWWIYRGATPSKLVVGIPLYGRNWVLASTNATAPRSPAAGVGPAGPYTAQAGFLAYYEICTNINNGGWTVVTESQPHLMMGPYAYSLSLKQWVGYDDPAMVAYKTEYALYKGLGGVMVWDMSMDDFHNTCSQGVNPLMTAISNTLGVGSNYTTVAPIPTSMITTTPQMPTTPFSGVCKYNRVFILNDAQIVSVLFCLFV